MKFVLLLFIGIHCLSVSRSNPQCKKGNFEAKAESGYFNCFDRYIQSFFYKALVLSRGFQELPQHCRSGNENIKKCYKSNRNLLVKFCKNKNINEAFENYTNIFKEAFEFICRSEPEDFDDSVYKFEEGKHCELPFEKMQECQRDHPFATMTGDYSDSFCRNGTEGLKCINEALTTENCNSVQIENVYKFYEALRNNTPCAKSD